MIYKIAFVGFLAFVGAVCYTASVVAGMADEEHERMMRDLWIEQSKNQNDQTETKDLHDASESPS